MAVPIPYGLPTARVALVTDGNYGDIFLGVAASARRRLLCSVFIVDVTPTIERAVPIDGFLATIAEAVWRGLDARLLIGGSRDNIALAEAAEAGRARARALGIPVRWLTSYNVRGSHAKLVVADDEVLTGSHNWSAGAVSGTRQTQDSVLVRSPELAALLAARFEGQWLRAEEPRASV